MRRFVLIVFWLVVFGALAFIALSKYEVAEQLEARILSNIQTGDVSRIWFSPGGELVGTAQNGSQLTVRVWSGAEGKTLRERTVNIPSIGRSEKPIFTVSPDASKLAWITVGGAHVESLISSGAGSAVELRPKRRAAFVALALIDSDSLAAFYDDNELEIRDIVRDKVTASKHLDLAEPVTLIASAQYLAAYSAPSGDTFVFDVGTGDKCSLIEHHEYPKDILSITVSPQGRFAAGMRETLEQQGRSLPAPGPIRTLAFYDRNRVLVGGDFAGIYLLGSDQGPQQVAAADAGATVLAAAGSRLAFGNSRSVAIASDQMVRRRVYKVASVPKWVLIALFALITPMALYVGYIGLSLLLKKPPSLGVAEPHEPKKPSEEEGLIPNALIEACQNGDCVLWTGGGLSAQAGLPTWSVFLRELLEWAAKNQLVAADVIGAALAELSQGRTDVAADRIAEALESRLETLYGYLRQRFVVVSDLPEAYRLIKEIDFPALITTTFDNLLDRTFPYSGGRVYTAEECVQLAKAAARRDFFLLKPFGDLDRPDSVRIGPAQCADLIKANPALSDFMEELLRSRVFLFLGVSPEGIERDLGSMVMEAPAGRKHYAFVPTTGEGWMATADRLRERYGIEPLTYSPSAAGHPEVVGFLSKLIAMIRERTSTKEYFAAGE